MEDTLDMKPEERIEYWELVMADFRDSGLSRTEYCSKNDIKISTFDYWKRKLSDVKAYAEDAGSRFAELKLSSDIEPESVEAPGFQTEMVINYGRFSICINSKTPSDLISRVLSEVSCA